jgi:hypothetical protein
MTKTSYRQCVLQRGSATQVAYIPQSLAKEGLTLRVREGGEWSDGWVVISVGATFEGTPDWRKAIRVHRQRTGDSLPKPTL